MKFERKRLILKSAAAAVLVACVLPGNEVRAQRHSPDPPDVSQPSRDLYGDGPDRIDMRHLERQRERSRNVERQKHLVDDTNRLLALAAQLRADVATHGSMTEEDRRHLEEIEKLARSVKDRMKG